MSSPSPVNSSAPQSRRSSTSSASSISSDNGETMSVFIKTITGDTTPLTVPTNTSISHLKTLIPLPTSTSTGAGAPPIQPQHLRLLHAGHHLPPTSTLAELSIPHNSTINVIMPIRGGAPKKPKCSFKECKEKAQPIVGDCGFCAGKFCAKHRMLEAHKCEKLESAKEEEKKRNREMLEKERTRPQAAV